MDSSGILHVKKDSFSGRLFVTGLTLNEGGMENRE